MNVRATRLPAPALLLALLAAAPAAVEAQSLFSGAGLGAPTEATDARSRSLGSSGVGLWGSYLLPSDPAAAAGVRVPTVVFTAQPSWVDLRRDDTGETGTFRSTRFPFIGVAYPARSAGMLTLTFGSVLDQRFVARRETSVSLLEETVDASDEFRSEGGVSELRLGLSRALGSGIAAGVQIGRYNGSSVRRLRRSLGVVAVEGAVGDYQAGGRWSYSGTTLTAGASAVLGTVARVAASVTWSGSLEARASEDTEGADRTFDVPLQVRVGATALLAPGLGVVGSYSHADWSSVSNDLAGGVARSATDWGVGLELSRARLLGRNAPLRVGYRRADLPFALEGGAPRETAWTFGLGLGLSQSNELTLAGVDVALERGERAEGALSERFWRASLSLRVAGF